MRLARNLMLLIAMAVAALAFTASTAMAQEEAVTVVSELPDGQTGSCVPVCTLHASGATSLVLHSGGMETPVSACATEVEGTIGANGSGTVNRITLTGPNCVSVECPDPANPGSDLPWPFAIGETGPDAEHIGATFCLLDSQGQPSTCVVEAPVTTTGDHIYAITLDTLCPSGVEVQGTLTVNTSATHDEIEIIH